MFRSLSRLLPTTSVRSRCYHERVLDHFNKPRNIGSLDENDQSVGTGFVGSPACGDLMKFQIKVEKDGTIVDVRHQVFGCGSAIE